MIITKLQFDPLMVQSQADKQHVRSAGLHLSQIYEDIEQTLARKKRKEMPDETLDSYRAIGFLFEHLVGEAMSISLGSDTWVRPGEVVLDGIIGSPDLFDISDGSVVETKATYRSFRHMGDRASGIRDEFWLWQVQMKGYCQMMGATTSKLYALFVNSDYKMYRPEFRAWQFDWTQQELVENWQMLVQHARRRGWL